MTIPTLITKLLYHHHHHHHHHYIIAIIITLQGNKNLKEYFRWSCLSIGGSSPLVDMLVFHENNPKVHALKCAKNVIFINLHKNGLSKLLVDFLLPSHHFKEIRSSLYSVVSDIFNFSPRYNN